MSNMNRPSRDYRLPDDSFLYNLDVNDWSMLAYPEGTDQPDDDQAGKADDSSGGNLGDGHSYSLEITAVDPELEQTMLEVEQGRRKLEELEQTLQEARQLLQAEGQVSCQMLQFDPELEQIMLEVEHGWRKLEELEQMLQEARQLVRELEDSEEQSSRQILQPDAKPESFERIPSRTSEGMANNQPGNHGQSKEMDQGIDWGYGMGRR